MPKERIIYVAPSLSSFIRHDITALSEKYHVIVNTYPWKKKYYTPLFILLQVIFFLRHITTTKSIIVSFGGYWSLVPTFIGKISNVPVAIILNGADCASIPPLNYGSLRRYLLRQFCRLSYEMATILLPVSSSLVYSKNTYHSYEKYSEQGLKYFFPKLKTKCHVLSNGFDTEFWKPLEGVAKEKNSFVAVISEGQFELKGGDLILQVADKFPTCTFYLAGLERPGYVTESPINVKFLGNLSQEELREYYRRCQFYFQISIFEGFGCALCEAMLCECVPIGSSSNVIPEIIGDSGFVLEQRDSEKLKELLDRVRRALNAKELGQLARLQVLENYSIEMRVNGLVEAIEEPDLIKGVSGQIQ